MVYLVGLAGLVCGFFFGQLILSHILRDYTREEIEDMLKNRGKKFKYGLLNWAIALAGMAAFLWAYRQAYS